MGVLERTVVGTGVDPGILQGGGEGAGKGRPAY